MKKLESIVTIEGGHTSTLVKRNDKSAIYRRETAEGQFVSFEVFAIMTKNGMEIYPNQTAVKNRWCMCPTSETKANTWFDRFTNGDVNIPNVDPVTGESIEKVDNRSIDELPDVNVSLDIPAPLGSHDNPVMFSAVDPTDIVSIPAEPVVVVTDILSESVAVEVPIVEDPTAPDDVPVVEVPEVTPTVDGGALVTVAKVTKAVVAMVIPTGEFTQSEFATANGLPERGVVWSKLDTLVKAGTLSKRFGTTGKGRPKAFFTATATV